MPRLASRADGRYIGSKVVGSVGAWSDLALATLDSTTGEAIPDAPQLVDLFVHETSGESPVYLLLRPHGAQGDADLTGALMVPAGTARAIGAYLPDASISTISIHGSARVEAICI
ncbi:MAG: hypothetical protein R3F65_30455 [bacterium]